MPETTPAPAKKAAAKAAPAAPSPHPNLASALVAFMTEKPRVAKNQEARIPGKDGRQGYSYKYADLADVDDAATPVLARHGLAFIAVPRRTEAGAYELVGTLVHTSGETMEGPLPLHGRTAQELGSSITYMRRYLLGAMTGIVTDDDDDGTRAQAAQAQRATPAGPPEDQPRQGPPPHIQQLWDLLAGLSSDEKDAVRVWWDQWATQGGMPEASNSAACTPAQVSMVEAKVLELREPAQGPQ